jgi:hypothetical protein
MFLECLRGGESLSLLLTATLSWEILYNMTRRASAKYLGVTISDDLKWESHINICGKANKTLGFLRRNLIPRHDREGNI